MGEAKLMSIADNREDGGRLVRQAWLKRCHKQHVTKESWLLPWEEMDEWDQEFDRVIWEEITAPYLTEIAKLQQQNQRLYARIDQLRDTIIDRQDDV